MDAQTPSSKADPKDQLLTAHQVAAMLNVTPRTIAEWAKQNKLPGFKMGRSWFFFERKLMAHLADEAERQAWR